MKTSAAIALFVALSVGLAWLMQTREVRVAKPIHVELTQNNTKKEFVDQMPKLDHHDVHRAFGGHLTLDMVKDMVAKHEAGEGPEALLTLPWHQNQRNRSLFFEELPIGYVQNLDRPMWSYYSARFDVGTPKQEFKFLVDTGSSWCWVWADLCSTDEEPCVD